MKKLIQWFKYRFSDPQVFVLGGFVALGAILVFWTGRILVPIFASLILAYLLEGPIAWLQRRNFPRPLAVGLVFSIFILALWAAFLVLIPLLYRQIAQIVQQIPSMATWAKQQLMLLPDRYPELVTAEQVTQLINVLQTELGRMGQNLLTISVATVRGLAAFLVYMLLLPLMVFFMLKDKSMLLEWFRRFLPQDHRLSVQIWRDVDRQIGNYIRGKSIEILIVWGVTAMIFSMLGLQAATLFGFFVGLSVLVPYVGVTVMVFPVAMMAYFQWGFTPTFGYTVGAYAVIQLIDGNLLAPLLLSGVVNLHPLAVVAAVLITGGLWGFWGVFFAIPLATGVQAILRALPSSQSQS